MEEEVEVIFKDQHRLRENLRALGNSEDERGLRERYVAEMTKEEDTLRDNRDEIHRLKQEKDKVKSELRVQIESLQFEHKL